MSPRVDSLADLPLDAAQHVDETCDRFESAFRSGVKPRIEDFVAEKTEPLRSVLFAELVKLEIQLRLKIGSDQTIVGDEYRSRFPDFREAVEAVLKAVARPVPHPEQLPVPHDDRPAALVPKANHAADANSPAELALPCQLGIYRLESKIGHGGMGTVYLALHQALDRRVAFKLMQRERMLKPEAVARFQREMKAVARLHHPNIVMAHDAGEVDGLHFLAMEHVAGWDLASICRCYGTLPIPVACECIRQVALGLQHVHEHGLVHRDIKPSNLMLTKTGEVKLLDLGLARLREDDQDERLTNDAPMGTIEYMAPEQARNPHGVDIRADLYSLGCTLFKLLSGFSPFARPPRTAIQLLSAHLETPPPAVRDSRDGVPQPLEDLIDWLLRKDPGDRPQTPADVVSALQPFASERILKSFACAVREISDANGHLPEKLPAGVGTQTGRWQPPPADFGHQDADAIPEAPIADPRPRDSESRRAPESAAIHVRSRRGWLFAAALAAAALTTAYFQMPRTESTITLLPRVIHPDDILVGDWKSQQGAIVSPVGGPAGCLRLTSVTSNDYQLDVTVASVEGGLHWTIVSTAEPRFAIEFRQDAQVTTHEPNLTEGEKLSPPNWRGDWGEYTDPSPRQFRLTVRDRHLKLQRDGEQFLDEIIPDGTLNCPLPENATRTPGIYLLTDKSSLRFSNSHLRVRSTTR